VDRVTDVGGFLDGLNRYSPHTPLSLSLSDGVIFHYGALFFLTVTLSNVYYF
jgi:hypothetical protein